MTQAPSKFALTEMGSEDRRNTDSKNLFLEMQQKVHVTLALNHHSHIENLYILTLLGVLKTDLHYIRHKIALHQKMNF